MDEITEKREKEKRTVRFMIEIYCRRKHRMRGTQLCPECQQLADYASARVDHCPFMKTKTFCSNCKVHCYKPDMREKIRNVMRFSGPRMILYCPRLVIRHKLSEGANK